MTPQLPELTLDEQNPWPGLSAFDETAQSFFNGRREEGAALRRLVTQAPLTVLFAASGLGKTSLLQAGLFPLVRKDSLPVYIRLDLQDTAAPLIEQAKAALQAEIRKRNVDAPKFRDGESLWEYLHRTGLEFWSEENQLLTPLFVFDQFEEVFTLGAGNAAAVARFRTDMADLIENRMPASLAAGVQRNDSLGTGLSLHNQRYKVLLSFREDFLPSMEGWRRDIPSLMRSRLRLLPMSGEQAFEAVNKTAPHLAPEPIARRIVVFVAAAGEVSGESAEELEVAPALLSLVCQGLNERRKEQGKEKFDEALLTGTGHAIVSDFYRKAVEELPERVHRFIEEQLITERGFRKPCDVDDARTVHGVADRDLSLLVDRRVLRIEPARNTERVELTHDLLTRVVREHRQRRRERARQRRRWAALAAVALFLMVTGSVAAYFRIQAKNAKRAALFFSAVAAEDPLVRALVVAELADSLDADDTVGSVQKVATAAIPIAVLGPRDHQDPNAALISAWFDSGGSQVGTVSISGNLAHWFSNGRGDAKVVSFSGPENHVSALAVSRDGKRMAAGFEDGQLITIRNDGSEKQKIPVAAGAKITALSLSPDANMILAGYADNQVRLWNIDGTVKRVLGDTRTGHTGPISSVQFSNDGKRALTASWDGTARIWETATGRALAVFKREDGPSLVYSAAFSPNGELVICGYEDGLALIWNSNGQGAPLKLDGHKVAVTTALFSPDGRKVVTGSEDQTARIWNLRMRAGGETGPGQVPAVIGTRTVLSGHTRAVKALAFSADGKKIVTASDDGTARIWWSNPKEPRVLGTHEDVVNGVAFSPDGKRVVSASDDKTAHIWSIDGSEPDQVFKSDGYVRSVAFDATGRKVAVAIEDGTVYVWEPGVGGTYLQEKSDVLSAAFSPDSLAIVTGTQDNHFRVWSAPDAKGNTEMLLEDNNGHANWVWSANFSQDGARIITASQDKTAKVWNADRARKPWVLKPDPVVLHHDARVLHASFSHDGGAVATASADRRARIWNLTETPPSAREFPHSDQVWSAELSSDGKWLLTASADKTAKMWRVEDSKPYLVFTHASGVRASAFRPNSLEAVTGAEDGRVSLWRTEFQELVKYLRDATGTACLTAEERVRFLAESPQIARSTQQACESAHNRTSPSTVTAAKH